MGIKIKITSSILAVYDLLALIISIIAILMPIIGSYWPDYNGNTAPVGMTGYVMAVNYMGHLSEPLQLVFFRLSGLLWLC